jgi:DNA-binding GntR family transcriptional regulator
MEREQDCIRWRDLNFLFHTLFYEPADRPLTLDMVARLRQRTDRTIRTHLGSMRSESERQHRDILEAVTAGDLERSVFALAHHLAYTSNDLQSWMRDEQSGRKR